MYGLKPVPFRKEDLPQELGPNYFSFLYGPTKEAAEKPEFFEGDGLQPVRNYFEMIVASATEGTTLSKQRLFPQPLKVVP